MTYEELMNILRQNEMAAGGVTPGGFAPLSTNDIVSGIQSQYQPVMQQAMPQMQSGASRFISGTPNFGAIEVMPEYGVKSQAAGPTFVPSAFNLEAYKNIDPKKLSDLIQTIESGNSGNDAASFSRAVDDAGLAIAPNISALGVGIGATLLGLATGLPLGLVASLVGRQNIANTMNNANNRSAAQFNRDLVALQSGLSNTPENVAALASMIDSLSAANQTTQAATPGATGTGGQAAQAAAQAAAAAQAMGLSPAQQAAAAQAAVNSVLSGVPVSQAVESATGSMGVYSGGNFGDTLADNENPGQGSDSAAYGGGNFGDTVSDNSDSVGRSDGNDSGGGGGVSGSGSGDASDGGGRGSDGSPYAKGGKVTKNRLGGKDPVGPDDGYASLDIGEYVIRKSAVDKYGDEIFSLLNDRKISKKKLQSLL